MSRKGFPRVGGYFGWRFAGALCLAGLVFQAHGAAGDAPEFPLRPAVAAYAKAHGLPVDGIDRPKDSTIAALGDTVTALATLDDEGARQQWLIRLKVVPLTDAERTAKPPPPVTIPVNGHPYHFGGGAPVAVEIYTAGPFDAGSAEPGRERTGRAVIASDFLGSGFTPWAKSFIRLRKAGQASGPGASTPPAAPTQLSEGDERAYGSGICALFSLFTVIQRTPGLAELFWRVAEKPSMWSIIKAGAGATFFIDTEGMITEVDAGPWRLGGADVYRIPFVVRFGQRPMLASNLIVGPSQSPLSATAGVIGISAAPPGSKSRRLEVRLLAAHLAQ